LFNVVFVGIVIIPIWFKNNFKLKKNSLVPQNLNFFKVVCSCHLVDAIRCESQFTSRNGGGK
jgi:hypothetical protein